jgi:hypothetical protein
LISRIKKYLQVFAMNKSTETTTTTTTTRVPEHSGKTPDDSSESDLVDGCDAASNLILKQKMQKTIDTRFDVNSQIQKLNAELQQLKEKVNDKSTVSNISSGTFYLVSDLIRTMNNLDKFISSVDKDDKMVLQEFENIRILTIQVYSGLLEAQLKAVTNLKGNAS